MFPLHSVPCPRLSSWYTLCLTWSIFFHRAPDEGTRRECFLLQTISRIHLKCGLKSITGIVKHLGLGFLWVQRMHVLGRGREDICVNGLSSCCKVKMLHEIIVVQLTYHSFCVHCHSIINFPNDTHSDRTNRREVQLRPFLYSRIPPLEHRLFRLDLISTGFFWPFFLSSVESIS